MRTFDTGATRDTAKNKPSYVGFFSPISLRVYGQYMLRHQTQSDGTTRAADNWKRGIPKDSYLDSLARHFVDLWLLHEGYGNGHHGDRGSIEDALCAIIFNAQGYLHEHLKAEGIWIQDGDADADTHES